MFLAEIQAQSQESAIGKDKWIFEFLTLKVRQEKKKRKKKATLFFSRLLKITSS